MQDNVLNLANPVNRAAPLNRGLLAWVTEWKSNNVGPKDVLRRYQFTTTGGPTKATSPVPGITGRNYNGSTDRMESPFTTASSYPFTVSTWLRMASTSFVGGAVMIGGGDTGANISEHGLVIVNGAVWALSQVATINTKAASSALTAGVWYHAAGVFASTTSRIIYVNGLPIATDTTSSSPTAANFARIRIGNRANNVDDQDFSGLLADSRIYDRALSGGEVQRLYNASRTGYQQELNWLDRPWLMGVPAAVGGNRRRRVLLGSH
jgi:hypothetical protein